jgi:hypothetical protein
MFQGLHERPFKLQTGWGQAPHRDRNGAGWTQMSSPPFDCSSRPVTSFARSPTELTNSTLRRASRCVSARHAFSGTRTIVCLENIIPMARTFARRSVPHKRVLVYASLSRRNRTSRACFRCSRLQCEYIRTCWRLELCIHPVYWTSFRAGREHRIFARQPSYYVFESRTVSEYSLTANIFMRSLSISSTAQCAITLTGPADRVHPNGKPAFPYRGKASSWRCD